MFKQPVVTAKKWAIVIRIVKGFIILVFDLIVFALAAGYLGSNLIATLLFFVWLIRALKFIKRDFKKEVEAAVIEKGIVL